MANVHRLRTASERVGVWLFLAGKPRLRRRLRRLRREAGEVRDLDVHLDLLPSRSIAQRLRERRRAAHRSLISALSRRHTEALLSSLAQLPPLSRLRAQARTRKLARKALDAGLVGDWRALHRLRKWTRRLRYALEWQHVFVSELVALQDALGEARDCRAAFVAAKQERHGGKYRRALKRRWRAAVARARACWRDARPLMKQLGA